MLSKWRTVPLPLSLLLTLFPSPPPPLLLLPPLQLCFVLAEDFGRIRTQGEEDLKKECTDDGQLVAVREKRSVDCKEGYFLIQVQLAP